MARSRDLLARMASLNRRPLRHRPVGRDDEEPSDARPEPDRDGHAPQETSPSVEPSKRARTSVPARLGGAIDGFEVTTDDGETAFLIETPVSEAGEGFAELSRQFRERVESAASGLRRRLIQISGVPSLRCEQTLFVDLETMGLSNVPVFLIGLMVWEEGLVVRQYFARSTDEERAILSLFLDEVGGKGLLISFNGKSFDVPYLRDRAATQRVTFDGGPPHLDLLHESRRAWRQGLPNHRLVTLEEHICGRTRADDIPSREIPAAYRAFLRTGETSRIGSILRHNVIDLVTLAELMVRLPDSSGGRRRLRP